MEGWGPYARDLEHIAPIPGYIQAYDKPTHEEINNSLDDYKPIEEYPEPLPVAQALTSDDHKLQYKKSGSSYRKSYFYCYFIFEYIFL